MHQSCLKSGCSPNRDEAAIGATAALLEDCTIAVERTDMTKAPDLTTTKK